MEIVCSTDNNYIMPTGIMICSLCENNQEEGVTFHVLSSDITNNNKKKLFNIIHRYNQKILFYQINEKDFSDFPVNQEGQSSHIHSLATYYRLLIGRILPANIHKVIYLDGDVIIRHSLKDLWNIDISPFAIAGVPDVKYSESFPYKRLHYSPNLGYINAGVLLINIDYWREHKVIDDFYALIHSHPERLVAHDQDILNYCFRNSKLLLNIKYNLQTNFLYSPQHQTIAEKFKFEIYKAIKDPYIIHYIFVPKPWFKDCDHPYKDEFIKYKSLTEWKDTVMERYYMKTLNIKYYLKKALIKLGFLNKSHSHSSLYIPNLKLNK